MGKKSFRFLWMGQSLANMGDVFYIVALISILYELTGSATFMALLPLFNTFSRLTGSLLVPILINRFRLSHILAYSQFGKTLLFMGLAIFSILLLGKENIWFIFLFIILIAFLDGWANPVKDALLPRIVPGSELVKANSFVASVDQTIQLGSWACGGLIVAVVGASHTIWLTLALYCVASLLMFLLSFVHHDIREEDEQTSEKAEGQFLAGWLAIWKTPFLRVISITEIIESSANVVWIAAIMYVYVADVLHVSEQWWGYVNASFFSGLLLGGILGYRYADAIERHIQKAIVFGAFLVMLSTLLFGLNSNPWSALMLSVLFGFSNQIKGVATQTFVQSNVQERLLPKVYAAQEVAILGIFGLSTVLFGFLTDQFGAKFIFLLAAALLFVSAILLFMFRRLFHFKLAK